MPLDGVFRPIGGETRLIRRIRRDVHGERNIGRVRLVVGGVDVHGAIGSTRGHSALHVIKRRVSERQNGIRWMVAEVYSK